MSRTTNASIAAAILLGAATAMAQEGPPPPPPPPPPPLAAPIDVTPPPAPSPPPPAVAPTQVASPPPAPPAAPVPGYDTTLPPAAAPVDGTPSPEAAPGAAPAAPPGAPPPAAAKKEEEEDVSGPLGPVRLGPIVGTGLPDLLSFGAVLKLTRYLDVGLVFGHIPTVQLSMYGDAQINYKRFEGFGRIYPLGGAFFLGAGVGYKTVSGTLSNTIDVSQYVAQAALLGYKLPRSIDIVNEGSVRTMVLTPRIGLFQTWKIGFSLGLDAGVQIPIAPSDVSLSTQVPTSVPKPLVAQFTAQYIAPNDQKVSDTLTKVGRVVIPEFNVRIGWLL